MRRESGAGLPTLGEAGPFGALGLHGRARILGDPPWEPQVYSGPGAYDERIAPAMGIEVEIRNVKVEQLFTMDEVFMTNSVMGVRTVARINGKDIAQGDIANVIRKELEEKNA